MQVVGILGGVASGKSLVSHLLQEQGAHLLDADAAGHDVLSDAEVESAARDRWGEAIFDSRGHIDRARLAAIVFAPPPGGPRERKFLEELTHGRIRRRIEDRVRLLAASGCKVAILDAPLLLEAGWDRLCDMLVFVEVPRDVRLARASTRGWSEEQFTARENAQLPVDAKRARADLILENAGSLEETRKKVALLWRDLQST